MPQQSSQNISCCKNYCTPFSARLCWHPGAASYPPLLPHSVHCCCWLLLSLFIRGLVQVKVWVKELRKMLGNDITLCIAGNKTDLEKERHVTVDEAETYAIADAD